MHSRQQIRAAVATAITGLTTTGSRVFISRVHALALNELPCLLVFTRNETSSRAARMGQSGRIERVLSVSVEAYVKLLSGYDNTLDDIAVQVEEALMAAPSLKALVKDIVLSETEIQFSDDGEKPVAVMTLTFVATYHTLEDDVETII